MLEHLELGTPGDRISVAGIGSHEDQVLSFQALPSETPRQDVSKAGTPTCHACLLLVQVLGALDACLQAAASGWHHLRIGHLSMQVLQVLQLRIISYIILQSSHRVLPKSQELWLLEHLKPCELSDFAGNTLIDILEQGAQWEVPSGLRDVVPRCPRPWRNGSRPLIGGAAASRRPPCRCWSWPCSRWKSRA